LIFVLVFLSRDSELDQNLSGDLRKNFPSDLNEIWYVGRGRLVMHDGIPYGRNQGQRQGHSREVDRRSPTGLIFLVHMGMLGKLVRLKDEEVNQVLEREGVGSGERR